MKGVYFDNLHSYNDLNLILSNVVIEPPEVKEKKIEVPGKNGEIDLTEFDGNIYYCNRYLSFGFSVKEKRENWASVFTRVNNAIHGKEMDIVLDDDPGFVWHGRVSVKKHARTSGIDTIEVEVDAEPYKYNKTSSLEEVAWDDFDLETGIMQSFKDIAVEGTQEVEVFGYRKSVVPVIIVAGTIFVTYNGKKTALSQGRNKVLHIVIKEGKNILSFTGSGTVSIEFVGGSL